MKTGAQIIKEYGTQSFATDTLSLEEMIDNEMEKIAVERDELLAALKELLGICKEEIPEFNIPRINDLIAKAEEK